MSSPEIASLGAAVLMGSALLFSAGSYGQDGKDAAVPQGPDLGEPLSPEAEARIDITIMPDGEGLPPGSGNAERGAQIFADQCEACHGAAGAKGLAETPALTGGIGSLASAHPVRTVNSFWPYAPLVFDYVRRTMPPTAPQSLSNDDTYSVVAYILSIDGLVSGTETIDKAALAKIEMPNRNGFVSAWPPRKAGSPAATK